jgi:membrane fusion protein, heavy metal efflux system
VVVALIAAAILLGPRMVVGLRQTLETDPTVGAAEQPMAALYGDLPDAVELPADVVQHLGVQVIAATPAVEPIKLQFSGTVTLDAEHFASVRSRFAGEVVDIPNHPGTGKPVGVGNFVKQGELLAVVWSRDLGEKKSDLIDALSRLQLDTVRFDRLKALFEMGDVPEQSVRDAELSVQQDHVAVDRATRTLQAWRVPPEEIEAVRNEAKNVETGTPTPNDELVERWARVELVAPFDGVVLERNLAAGQLVGPDDDLFKIGDLSRLRIVAFAYEEDLPRLDALPESERRWRVMVPANPELPSLDGTFDRIGHIIDPNQHTGLVMGWVDNPSGTLRVGQFIKATVQLPPPPDEVMIPATALVERGPEKFVFVQPDPSRNVYQMRRVQLGRRLENRVTLRTGEGAAVRSGELVVTSGSVEVLAALRDLQARQAASRKGTAENRNVTAP